MGREVFVSYKYSDAVDTREEIRKKLGKDGHFYNGEKGFVALEKADSTIKEYLKEMIFSTSVTVVVISPQVRFSKWVDWEIRYSLREQSRDGRTSHRNGIVCVVQCEKDWYGNENCSWAKDYTGNYKKDIFPQAIIDNLQTTFPSPDAAYASRIFGTNLCEKDYCVVISETSFKSNPSYYIEQAYNRAHDESYKTIVNKTIF